MLNACVFGYRGAEHIDTEADKVLIPYLGPTGT